MKTMPSRRRRRGAVLPTTAILMVLILACVALAVDLGYVLVVHGQLQNAADAAALAGASRLLDNSALQGTPDTGTASSTAMTNARSYAQTYAQQNYGGGVALTLGANPSNSSTGDVVCGYLSNPSDHTRQLTVTTPGVGPYPNSVQAHVHRDGVRNGSLSLFFARALGVQSWNLDATATATYDGGITGFQISAPGYSTCKLIPFALEVHAWSNAATDSWYDSSSPGGVLQGVGPDIFTRDASTSTISSGSDNIHECKLFPLSNGNGNGNGVQPGNFGTVNIGSSSNSTAVLSRQIQYGPNATDLSYYPNGRLQLDPNTGTLLLNGDTGISGGMKGTLDAIIGQPRILPLYSSVSGNGNNAQYTIVGFAGVTICEEVLTGSLSTKHITMQPCWCIDPNALGGGTSSSSFFVTRPLALTR